MGLFRQKTLTAEEIEKKKAELDANQRLLDAKQAELDAKHEELIERNARLKERAETALEEAKAQINRNRIRLENETDEKRKQEIIGTNKELQKTVKECESILKSVIAQERALTVRKK